MLLYVLTRIVNAQTKSVKRVHMAYSHRILLRFASDYCKQSFDQLYMKKMSQRETLKATRSLWRFVFCVRCFSMVCQVKRGKCPIRFNFDTFICTRTYSVRHRRADSICRTINALTQCHFVTVVWLWSCLLKIKSSKSFSKANSFFKGFNKKKS